MPLWTVKTVYWAVGTKKVRSSKNITQTQSGCLQVLRCNNQQYLER